MSKMICFFPTLRSEPTFSMRRRRWSCVSHRSGVSFRAARSTLTEKTHMICYAFFLPSGGSRARFRDLVTLQKPFISKPKSLNFISFFVSGASRGFVGASGCFHEQNHLFFSWFSFWYLFLYAFGSVIVRVASLRREFQRVSNHFDWKNTYVL